jgi:hypothetical protein
MLAAIQAAFPGDSLAAQLMRDIAEIVVSKAHDRWRERSDADRSWELINSYLVELGLATNRGLAKVPKQGQIYWRQAIAEHPAWEVQPPTPSFTDTVWVLSKQQLLRLAASPTAAEAAVAKVQAAHLTLEQTAVKDTATYSPTFRALALKELAEKRVCTYKELCALVVAQDTELQGFFQRTKPGPSRILHWLSQDPRFQVGAGRWNKLTKVSPTVPDPSGIPAPLSQASSDGNPATLNGVATSDSITTSSAGHVSQAAAVGSSGCEGDSSTAAARFRAFVAARLSPGVPAQLAAVIKAALYADMPISPDGMAKRGQLAWEWLSEDPRFHLSRDKLGNNYVALRPAEQHQELKPARQQQEQPSQPPVAEEMQLAVHPDGTAHLVPGSSAGNSDGSATPPHPSDDDITSFINLLPHRSDQPVALKTSLGHSHAAWMACSVVDAACVITTTYIA